MCVHVYVHRCVFSRVGSQHALLAGRPQRRDFHVTTVPRGLCKPRPPQRVPRPSPRGSVPGGGGGASSPAGQAPGASSHLPGCASTRAWPALRSDRGLLGPDAPSCSADLQAQARPAPQPPPPPPPLSTPPLLSPPCPLCMRTMQECRPKGCHPDDRPVPGRTTGTRRGSKLGEPPSPPALRLPPGLSAARGRVPGTALPDTGHDVRSFAQA